MAFKKAKKALRLVYSAFSEVMTAIFRMFRLGAMLGVREIVGAGSVVGSELSTVNASSGAVLSGLARFTP